ncbi:TRAP transporter large permease [Aquibacillus sediminis]|uniref:TRAP transporter large permease n=1 Tax=Aquibacillus sediminis TaxID=2574734 RepID=UPI001107B043|nr:TRAP transporter large permease subunit [Aquibacillus sediminis]
MSDPIVGVMCILAMFLLLTLRVPIAFSMALPAILGILYLKNWNVLANVIDTTVMNNSLDYIMTTIAMFVLMGELMNVSGISGELYRTFKIWFGKLRGGMGIATISASAVFAASSGSSLATTASLGTIASKEMLKNNYSKTLTSGSIIAGGTLGIMIPPSTFMILYGVIAQQHIGKLLLAGLVPGILLALLYILTVMIIVSINPQAAQKGEHFTWKQRFQSISSIFAVTILFIFVIGGLYVGLFGPTEAASMGAFGALIIALFKRSLTVKKAIDVLSRTLKTVGFLFAILLSALILNSFIVQSGIPTILNNFLTGLAVAPVVIFILIVFIYIILGAFMDAMAAMLVTFPIVLPLIESLGYDLIWFGVVMCILMELALISPPIGMNAFILNGVANELKLTDIFKGSFLFILPILALIIIVYLFPQIILFLPNHL